MTRNLLHICLFLMAFSIITLSCVDHDIPSEDPVIETGNASGVSVPGGIDMNFRVSFKNLGSGKVITQYGIAYIPYTTDLPKDDITFDNPEAIFEAFTAPAILGELTHSQANFPHKGAIYYRAYASVNDQYIVYGEKKSYILPQ
ncbi:hypothetical protein MUK70_10895 [Dyadobacter chenwenxiniae]|uniref:DUF4625 domain-containing protein n=1 Tax=Dyadobacter chenwenxiniae TaxID=2906456 RepID=A0A9X1PRG5_9BACT|nr:hypothetical protein [Dyadobacter chenwenxiniae]MCF0065581.1 hypothetical protein [Dyadobacter chenwenxiniae]UON85492.1 hypothetical protein MUK70_10895 [Dyadobacter chenwenxiniae]